MGTKRWARATTLLFAMLVLALPVYAEDLAEKVRQMEIQLNELKRELEAQKAAQEKAAAAERERAAEEKAAQQKAAEAQAAEAKTATGGGVTETAKEAYKEVSDRVKLGGYGSMRFEASDLDRQKNSFLLRRLVLTADANIAPRLRSYFELEFERFRKLELERELTVEDGVLTGESAIEGTTNSEISLEQVWLQYDLTNWLRLRGGGVLVPVGRFNINHDDNRWDLPRRSLIDRGVPVLPTTSAWDELGVGFNGDIPVSEDALLNYQVYVMNGVALDSEFETKVEQEDGVKVAVTEIKVEPSTGGFAQDVKDSKAAAGRLAFSPALGHEVAGSFYYGQYTPDFLSEEYLWSFGLDGRTGYGPFELEGEALFTRFENVDGVAASFAQAARDQSSVSSDPSVVQEVEFELANLARNKYGYWLEMRYRFWPTLLNDTVFGKPFANPQFVAVFRPEQAWLDGLIGEAEFVNGELLNLEKSNRRVDRFTVGLAYRPVPLVAFQLAYEYTQTDSGKSLSDVTNHMVAGPDEDHANTVMIGAAFGF